MNICSRHFNFWQLEYIFSLLAPVAARFEPSNYWSWVDWFTSMPVPLANCEKIFLLAIYSCTWIWSLNLGIMGWLFYHCATVAHHIKPIFYSFLSPYAWVSWFWMLELISWVDCFTTVLLSLTISNQFFRCLKTALASACFKPLNLGSRADCFTFVLQSLIICDRFL